MSERRQLVVGRDGVLNRLCEVVHRGRTSAAGIVLTGDPGMGKTTLITAAAAVATPQTEVVMAEGIEVVAGYAFAGLSQVAGPLLARATGLVPRHREVLESALALGAPVPHDDFAVAASTLGLLAEATARGPVLIVVDDAQWVDGGSLSAILFAVRRLKDHPLAVLIARRPTTHQAVTDLPEISLQALDTDSARRVVIANCEIPRRPEEIERIVAMGSGVPLALVELAAINPGDMTDDPEPIARVPVDKLMNRLFGQRVAALSAAASSAATVAALEEPGEHVALVEAARALGANELAWDELQTSGVVRIQRQRIDFTHPLLRRAVIAVASPAALRQAHEALGAALEARGDHARALSHRGAATIGADEALAVELERAAEEFRARAGHPAAATAYAEAARLSTTTLERARRKLLGADAARRAGEFALATSLAAEAAQGGVDLLVRHRATLIQAHVEARIGSTHEALRQYTQAADQVAGSDPDLAALALSYASSAAAVVGDGTGSLAAAVRADAIDADVLSESTRIAVKECLGSALALTGDAVRARPMLHDVALWYLQQDDRTGAEYIAEALMWLGDFDLALCLLDDVAADARRLASPGLLVQVLELRADLRYRTGDWSHALADATEAVTLAQDTGQTVLLAYSRAVLAILQAMRGLHDDGRRTARQALDDADRHGLTVVGDSARFALGAIELAMSNPNAALIELETISKGATAGGRDEPAVCLWSADLIEALIAADRRTEAHSALSRLEAQGVRTLGEWTLGIVARYRGLLAPDSDFDEHFAAATAHHTNSRMPFELGRTRFCYGQRLRRAGRRIDARAQFREALTTFASLRAEHWSALAQRELASAGERPPPAVSSALDSLTPQELQIAQCISGGATNREAASELFLSPKTIETHLTRIYRKLGVRSRTGLVALITIRS